MGRILRRFARFHEMDFVGKVVGGTWAVPIAQELAGPEYGVQTVKTATALGGEVSGGYFGVRATIARAGDLVGARVRATVNTNVVLTGGLLGQRTEVELLGTTGQITGTTIGQCIEMYSEAGCVHTSSIRGLWISNYLLGTKGADYDMLRLEENGTAVINNLIGVFVLDCAYFAHFSAAVPAAGGWNNAGGRMAAPDANEAGWLKVHFAVGGDRYIQLFV